MKDNIPINKDIDIEILTFEDAKKIVDSHMLYNNKLIGSRDDKDVVLKNGQYGLYLVHDKKLYTLPKFILDKLDTLDIKKANYIIDYQLKIKIIILHHQQMKILILLMITILLIMLYLLKNRSWMW